MPSHSYVDIDFEPYIGPNPRSTGVFVNVPRQHLCHQNRIVI